MLKLCFETGKKFFARVVASYFREFQVNVRRRTENLQSVCFAAALCEPVGNFTDCFRRENIQNFRETLRRSPYAA